MKKLLLIAVLAVPIVAIAEKISFEDAKQLADNSEQSISSQQLGILVSAQGELASVAFPQCMSRTQTPPTNFTVVVELSGNGKVKQSWLSGESNFAQCFHSAMANGFNFTPPSLPFFTAFEYTNAP